MAGPAGAPWKVCRLHIMEFDFTSGVTAGYLLQMFGYMGRNKAGKFTPQKK